MGTNENHSQKLRHQQKGGGMIFRDMIIGGEVVGSRQVMNVVKMPYCLKIHMNL